MALRDGLVEYWPLNEASGNRTGVHAGKVLTDNGTVSSATGLVYSTAADFELSNGDESLSRSGDSDLAAGDVDFTVACWFKLETEPADSEFRTLVQKAGGSQFEFRLFIAGSGGNQNVAFGTYGGGTFPSTGPLTDLVTGRWYLGIGWHDSVADIIGCQLSDGVATTTATGGANASGADPFRIGAGETNTLLWDGLIGPVMFWKNRILTATERYKLFNMGSGLRYDVLNDGSWPRNVMRPKPFSPGLAR